VLALNTSAITAAGATVVAVAAAVVAAASALGWAAAAGGGVVAAGAAATGAGVTTVGTGAVGRLGNSHCSMRRPAWAHCGILNNKLQNWDVPWSEQLPRTLVCAFLRGRPRC